MTAGSERTRATGLQLLRLVGPPLAVTSAAVMIGQQTARASSSTSVLTAVPTGWQAWLGSPLLISGLAVLVTVAAIERPTVGARLLVGAVTAVGLWFARFVGTATEVLGLLTVLIFVAVAVALITEAREFHDPTSRGAADE